MDIADLPTVAVENGIRSGRSLHDGYQRGIAIAFRNLGAKVEQDEDFRRARDLAGNRTIVNPANLWNIFLILKFYIPQLAAGHIVEFGSYKGGSAIFMSALAQSFMPDTEVFAFDTFAGMPVTDRHVDYHSAGDFGDVDLAELRRYAETEGLQNLHFIQGQFEDTARSALIEVGRISLCHIDCDLRAAIECAYESAKPYMVPGGYWIFDDPLVATCLGATEAVEDLLIRRDGLNSEQICPHYVFREPFDKVLP